MTWLLILWFALLPPLLCWYARAPGRTHPVRPPFDPVPPFAAARPIERPPVRVHYRRFLWF